MTIKFTNKMRKVCELEGLDEALFKHISKLLRHDPKWDGEFDMSDVLGHCKTKAEMQTRINSWLDIVIAEAVEVEVAALEAEWLEAQRKELNEKYNLHRWEVSTNARTGHMAFV